MIANRPGAGLATAFMTLGVTAAHAAGDGGGLPQLDTATFPTQIFWLIVTFTLLYLIMSKLAVPRIAGVLEERQERIEDDIETADRLRGEAETVRLNYEAAIADSRARADSLVRKATDGIAEAQARAEARAAARTAESTREAEARIAARKGDALTSLKTVAGESAAEATRKLTGLEIAQTKIDAAVEAAMRGGA